MKTFTGSYLFGGELHTFRLEAANHTDAERRLEAIQERGRIDGEVVAEGECELPLSGSMRVQ